MDMSKYIQVVKHVLDIPDKVRVNGTLELCLTEDGIPQVFEGHPQLEVIG